MPADTRSYAPLFGVVFFVLAMAGTLAAPAAPGFAAPAGEITAYFTDHDGAVVAANALYLLAGAALLAFVGALWSSARRAEGGTGLLAAVVLAGGAGAATMMISGAALEAMGGLRVAEQGAVDPAVAVVLWDASAVLYGLAAPAALAVLVLAVALLALRHGLLPAWHGGVSALLGLALLVPPISWVAAIVFTFWVLATSLLLQLRTAAEPATVRAGAAPAAA